MSVRTDYVLNAILSCCVGSESPGWGSETLSTLTSKAVAAQSIAVKDSDSGTRLLKSQTKWAVSRGLTTPNVVVLALRPIIQIPAWCWGSNADWKCPLATEVCSARRLGRSLA